MPTYSPEQIGKAVSKLYTDVEDPKVGWDMSPMHRGLEQRHESNPAAALEVAEILPVLERHYGAGRAGAYRRDLVDHEAAGGEHVPHQIPWACDVDYEYDPATGEVTATIPGQRVRYRFPEPAYLIELARDRRNQVMGLTIEQARKDNTLIRIYRHTSRAFRAQDDARQAELPPRRRRANRHWLRGMCDSCSHEIFLGQVVMWDPGRQLHWHDECPDPATVAVVDQLGALAG